MISRSRSINNRQLLEDVAKRLFGLSHDQSDTFGIEFEVQALCGHPDSHRPELLGIDETIRVVKASAEDLGCLFALLGKGPADRGKLSLEPGGQIEYSSRPSTRPVDAFEDATRALGRLAERLAARGASIHAWGITPWHSSEEIGLRVPDQRRRGLRDYLRRAGTGGDAMLMQAMATHVNIGFGTRESQQLRWRAAQMLSPIALATFANSPVVVGRSTGHSSFRGHIWTTVDPTRCGFPAGVRFGATTDPAEDYTRFALMAKVALRRWSADRVLAADRPLRFIDWMDCGLDGSFPDIDDWRYHLTTLFPEVRPKGHLELRTVDGLPRAFWAVPFVWWVCLLCDDEVVRTLPKVLGGTEDLLALSITAARDGLSHEGIRRLAQKAFAAAERALDRLSDAWFSVEMRRAFEVYGQECVNVGRTPADHLLELLERKGRLDYGEIRELEERWLTRVETVGSHGAGQ